ncbi:MAG: hypothetical protein PHR83_11015 [Paludibacter sp.]|nr:hypothetical protein [Paludibacter sp.]
MKRLSISTLLLLLVLLPVFGQKEVFFTNIPKDSIKVESMHGISIGSEIDFLSTIQNLISNDKSYYIPLGISYFNENRVAPTITFMSVVGLSAVFSKSHLYTQQSDGTYYYSFLDPKYTNSYSLQLGAGIEPRWYFGYKRRYEQGKASLNSGWYLSLPVNAGTRLIDTNKNNRSSNYINYVGFGAGLNLGYRRAISKQWFLEGNVSLLGISTALYSINKQLNLYPLYIGYPRGISLSAAYTFK